MEQNNEPEFLAPSANTVSPESVHPMHNDIITTAVTVSCLTFVDFVRFVKIEFVSFGFLLIKCFSSLHKEDGRIETSMVLSSDEWLEIIPKNGERRLVGCSSYVISTHLQKSFPECAIVFKRNIIHKENSRKKSGVHLRISGICKFSGNP